MDSSRARAVSNLVVLVVPGLLCGGREDPSVR